MRFAFRRENFDAILDYYHRNGFVLLTEVDQRIPNAYRRMLAAAIGVSTRELQSAGANGALELTRGRARSSGEASDDERVAGTDVIGPRRLSDTHAGPPHPC